MKTIIHQGVTFMKTAVIYYSRHRGNTKKLLDAIAERFELTLIDAAETPRADLTEYDLIGFASGIYYSKFHKSVLKFAESCLPEGKRVFFLCTYGAEKQGYTQAIRQVTDRKRSEVLGEYGCLGFDTFGPFKLVGGIAKGHPDRTELAGAVRFFEGLVR